MILRGINFGPILCGAGAQNVFGGKHGKYLHQKLLGPFGPKWGGCTLVTKTTTLEARAGNMPMKKDGTTPKEFSPRCILPNFHYGNIALSLRMFRLGIMLNAVSLSGPGAEPLLKTGRWQALTSPFMISFMSVAKSREERLGELQKFVDMLARYLPAFRAHVGLQINLTCPNVHLDLEELLKEARFALRIASALNIPIVVKINVLASVEAAKEIAENPHCDALCISNTIHWDKLPEVGIDRKALFGTDISPLAEFGGGALSGEPLRPIVIDWVRRARKAGITIPINAGGGILAPDHVDLFCEAGASSVFVACAGTLRSWRVKSIIARAHELYS